MEAPKPHRPQAGFDDCTNTTRLRARIETLCANLGEVLNVTLVCNKPPARGSLCIVDFIPGHGGIERLAERLGGSRFGDNAVSFAISLPPGFSCQSGFPPTRNGCSCVPR